jgi:phosphomannomutase
MRTISPIQRQIVKTPVELIPFVAAKTSPEPGKDRSTDDIFELRCAVQHYVWGDRRFIPALLGNENTTGKPFAELWMGTHPDGMSKVILQDGAVSLDRLIRSDPEKMLHPAVADRFDRKLPFLFKVLAAALPLSVQVHPSRTAAKEGFAKENAAGIKLDAAERNYRDSNHKPELIVALTDFYALRGFRAVDEIVHLLGGIPELRLIAKGEHGIWRRMHSTWVALQTAVAHRQPGREALRSLYSTLMSLPQEKVDSTLNSLVQRVEKARWDKPYTKSDWEYWLLRARDTYSHASHQDRGLFAFLLLNLVHLQPGEGLFLPAGVLHSYLEGAGVELMANSNNVIRGGLTPKHVDVGELLRNVKFDEGTPEIIRAKRRPESPEWVYATPAAEFQLSRIELNRDNVYRCEKNHPLEMFLVVNASARPLKVQTEKGSKTFGKGQVFFIPADTACELRSTVPVNLFKATIPLGETVEIKNVQDLESPCFRGRQPVALTFGTSGLRGLVTDITDLEAYINTRGFLKHAMAIGDISPGKKVSIAADLRPSSDGPVRSILRTVAKAVTDSGLLVDNLGYLPTPALVLHTLQHKHPGIMVTGSHIPFDRNGIKFNLSTGEVLKSDEAAILRAVKQVRNAEYSRPVRESLFDDNGMFKAGQDQPLPAENSQGCLDYFYRYLDFFPFDALAGQRIIFYQHSAVGRDILHTLLITLGAEAIPMGRSENFMPVDTEAISEETLKLLQRFADQAQRDHGRFDAIVSTDGDSDRPLLAAITASGEVKFYSGDLLGIIAADFLKADAVAVPISANDAVNRWAAANGANLRLTKIGSPYVIEAMQQARAHGAKRVVGWEANGGFMTATDIVEHGRTLAALPTRDAALPLVAALYTAKKRGLSLSELFAELPHRFGKSGLIDNFPPETSLGLIRRFSPLGSGIKDMIFSGSFVSLRHTDGKVETAPGDTASVYEAMGRNLERFFLSKDGFGQVVRLNVLDGLRVWFDNGDIAHIRPSGNAPQLRIYAVADTQARADEIVTLALREPDGILRQMEAAITPRPAVTGFAERVGKNIALAKVLFARGETPELIATVSGSKPARDFWQTILDRARPSFKASTAMSFEENLPTNQAFGLLLLWQRIRPHLHTNRGALAAFVFGDGTRATPFTETDNAQKPAMATFVRDAEKGGQTRFLSMVELALHYFVPVQQFLRRSGFNGLVVKWGDEVQIPTRELTGADALFQDADIVRFVSMRTMNADEAKNKDWVGVDECGTITAFIPRRPLEQMEALAQRGLLQRRGGALWGGINLGSIAVSGALLDCLDEEFKHEVNDTRARREDRPALDPEFFTALAIAAIENSQACAEAWEQVCAECAEVRALTSRQPDLVPRLRRAIRSLEIRQKRKFKMVAMDFGDQYWGDIGQHAKIFDFYMALNEQGSAGETARAIAGLPSHRDAQGNYIVNSTVAPGVRVSNSVLINATITDRGTVERSVLIGTRAGKIEAREGFDVLSTVTDLRLEPRSGTYKVVANQPVHARPRERLTTLFLPPLGPRIFRVFEDTDLKNKAANYAVSILGNPLSFREAHAEMGAMETKILEKCRREAEAAVLKLLPLPG